MKKILIIIALLGPAFAFGQNKNDSSATDKVDVFSEHYYNDHSSKVNDRESYVLKINPLLFANGEIPIYAETGIGKSFSVEVGVGITSKDYISMLTNYRLFKEWPDYSADDNFKNTVARPGYLLKLGIRYYLGVQDFPEGYYFALEGRYTTHNLDFKIPDMTNLYLTQTGSISLSDTYLDAVILNGYQLEVFDHAYIDFYTGIGARQQHIEYVTSASNNYTPANYFSKASADNLVVLFSVGLKLGYSF